METKTNIDSKKIQSELNALWGSQGTSPLSKASLFNLIVYTHEPRRIEYFKNVIEMIMGQLPCRIIFIQAKIETRKSYLRIHVGTQKEKDIYCDQITIEASGEDLLKVPFLILPLFVPDIPIYLLWGQDPTSEGTILPSIQKYATRLIFDSDCTDNLQRFSQEMLIKQASCPLDIVDMTWARIGGWREVLSKTFDSKERIEELANAQQIKIIYNNLPSPYFAHPEMQAIYLQAWLAARLDWKFDGSTKQEEGWIVNYRKDKAAIQIFLSGQKRDDLPSEDLIGFEAFGENNYECHISRSAKNQVLIHDCNQSQCQLPFTLQLPSLQTGRNFIQEIFYQKSGSHYIPMLKLISQANWS